MANRQNVVADKWFPSTDAQFIIDVNDGTALKTPVNCTAFLATLEFVVRDMVDGVLIYQVGLGSGIALSNSGAVGGVNDRVTVTAGKALNALCKSGKMYSGALWRTDATNANPIWMGDMPCGSVAQP